MKYVRGGNLAHPWCVEGDSVKTDPFEFTRIASSTALPSHLLVFDIVIAKRSLRDRSEG